MTASSVIALVVAATIILACCWLFMSVLIRGRVEASGYMFDWKTNPVSMATVLVLILVSPMIIIYGLINEWKRNRVAPVEQYQIFVDFRSGFRPDFRYIGPGVQRELAISEDDAGAIKFSFSAMSLPNGITWELGGVNDLPEYRIFDFTGLLSCSDGIWQMNGNLQSRNHGRLLILPSGNDVNLHPGRNHIAITWNVEKSPGKGQDDRGNSKGGINSH